VGEGGEGETLPIKITMAKPNYSGEKRRKDLAKTAKKEEKRLRKLHAKENPPSDNAGATEATEEGQELGSEG